MARDIEITFVGLTDLFKKLDLMTESRQTKQTITDAVGASTLDRIRKSFLDEKDPEGKAWIPSTFGLRRKESGRGGGTLFDTGTLFHSIQFARKTETVGEISTDVPYAAKHHFGQDGEVERPFMGVTRDDANTASLIAAAILERIAKKN